jgi:hypothetical protein
MIELKNDKHLERAIQRAKTERQNLVVRMTNEMRCYKVENRKTGQVYEVNFKISSLGTRLGHCTCKAGELGIHCKHLICAASLNTCLAAQGYFNRQTQPAK